MNRRKFIQASAAFAALGVMAASCKTKKKIRGGIVGASAHTGHLLRDKIFTAPVEITGKEIVIVGAGVSGLSAGRWLEKQGIKDFIVLDLEKKEGGNAAHGANAISAYPWGAHYVPIPNVTLREYIDFLKEAGVVTGEENGTPVYNEFHLCFDPQERLYINGRWQEGLIPHFGVPEEEMKEIAQFLQRMDEFRQAIGHDGKEAFALPVDNSSKEEKFVQLDRITMKQWLQEHNFHSSYLHNYINYCTRDDFGTPYEQASAWAGIHYFACRKGKAVNASAGDVLTWPAGNGWLVQQLASKIKSHIQTGCLAVEVKSQPDGVMISYFDVKSQQLKAFKAKQCILAVPQFVACRLLHDKERQANVEAHLQYAPWMVANLTVTDLEERSGAPLSWDNVLYNSASLGYVEASHELLTSQRPKRNLTYYLPLTASSPADERKAAQQKTHEEWTNQVINDLKIVHPNIENAIEEINIMLWGHAMAQPVPGLIHGPIRKTLSASLYNKIHFAHTDLAGVSLFEEAFYQGLKAAKIVTTNLVRI